MTRPLAVVTALTLLLLAPLAAAVDPADETVVSEDTTLTEPTSYAGDLRIQSGATLTVQDEVHLPQGATVHVEAGATLHLEGGLLKGEEVSAFASFAGFTSTIELPVDGLTGSTQVRIHMHETLTGNESLTVEIGDEEAVDPSGDTVDLTVMLDGSASTLLVNVSHMHPIPFGPTHIEMVDGSANQRTVEAWEFEGSNLVLTWGLASFAMVIDGHLQISDGTVQGADIVCAGTCEVEDAMLIGSAPVIVEDGGSMTIRDSTVLGSRTDEDIVAVDDADLVYENNTGTGGWTDNWIRRLSSRVVLTNMPSSLISGQDLGYEGRRAPNAFAVEMDGALGADFGNVEANRIVEWVNGTGVYGKEEGTWTVTGVTGWGTFTTTMPAMWSTSSRVDLQLPAIEVLSVEPERRTGDANTSLGVMLTVVNTGAVRADTPVLECTVDGEPADTSPGYIELAVYGGLDPGQEMDIPLTWRAPSGSHALSCGILSVEGTTLETLADVIAPAGATSSVEVSFTDPEEPTSTPFTTIGIALAILFLGIAGIARVAGSKTAEKVFEEAASETLSDEDPAVVAPWDEGEA